MARSILIFAGSGIAASALAAALSLAGFAPRPGAPAAIATTDAAMAANVAPEPTVQVDPIYVPAPAPPTTVTVHRTVSSSGGGGESEPESETEGGGD